MAEERTYTAEQAATDRVVILESLGSMTAEARARLRAANEAVAALDEDGLGDWVSNEGKWPFFSESDEVKELRAAMREAGVIVAFDWPAWHASLADQSILPIDDPVSAVRTITLIVRKNRFNEGFLLSQLKSGLLTDAIRAALTG